MTTSTARTAATRPSPTTITSITFMTASCTTSASGGVVRHALAISDANPADCTLGHNCAEHGAAHEHGPDCGHEPVPHSERTSTTWSAVTLTTHTATTATTTGRLRWSRRPDPALRPALRLALRSRSWFEVALDSGWLVALWRRWSCAALLRAEELVDRLGWWYGADFRVIQLALCTMRNPDPVGNPSSIPRPVAAAP